MAIIGFFVLLFLGSYVVVAALAGAYVSYCFSGLWEKSDSILFIIMLCVGGFCIYSALNNSPFSISITY